MERTAAGLVPAGDGWFVVNSRDGRWTHADGRGARLTFEGEGDAWFPQTGIGLFVLEPGEPMGMYHREADQEDFLVIAGEALLIIEGEERPLRRWDFVHCPAHTDHIIVGAGESACTVLAIGAREHEGEPGALVYPVNEVALRHGAGVESESEDGREAYAYVEHRRPVQRRDGWPPES